MRRAFVYLATILSLVLVSFRSDLLGRNLASAMATKVIFTPAGTPISHNDLQRVEYLLQPTLAGTDVRSATRAHLLLGLVWDRAGNRQRAMDEWRLADSASLWEDLSSLAWSQGKSDDAIEFRKQAIAVAPSHLGNYFMLAWLYWPGTGRVDESIKVYSETAALAAPGSFERYLAEGYLFRLQQNWAQALDRFEQALRIKPTRVDVHRLAAYVAGRSETYSLAIDHLKQAINLSPLDSCIDVDLGDIYRDVGQYAEASTWYSRAARIYPKNCAADPGHASLGRLYFEQRLFAKAASEYRAAITLNPTNKDYHCRLAQAYERGGRISEALGEYLRTLELDATDLDAKQSLMRLLHH